MRSYLFATLMLAVFSVAVVQTQDAVDDALEEVDVAGCLASPGKSGVVVGSEAELYRAVGRNADADKCRRRLEALDIDFEAHALAGLTVSSGHCTRPKDFRATMRRDDVKMMTDVTVDFEPSRNPCRGLQRFDVWVLVPRAQGHAIRIRDGRWHKIDGSYWIVS